MFMARRHQHSSSASALSAPAALVAAPAVAVTLPAGALPMMVAAGRHDPATRGPYPPSAVEVPVTIGPDVTWTRRIADCSHRIGRRRRPDGNSDVTGATAAEQHQRAQQHARTANTAKAHHCAPVNVDARAAGSGTLPVGDGGLLTTRHSHCSMIWPSRRRISPQPPFSRLRSPDSP